MEVLQETECMILVLGFLVLGYYLWSAGLEIALGSLAGRPVGDDCQSQVVGEPGEQWRQQGAWSRRVRRWAGKEGGRRR